MVKEKQTPTKRVVIVHMRNDLSGSTRVLSQAIEALKDEACQIDLYTATIDYEGFLSDLPGVNIIPLPYSRYTRRWKSFNSYLYSQIWLFFKLLQYLGQPAVFYISTVLPFGASLSGWVMRKQVVYHLHEVSLAPAPWWLKKWLFGVVRLTASKTIYVSHFLKEEKAFGNIETVTIHNSLSHGFLNKAEAHKKSARDQKSILMICSLAGYKGITEFFQLAKKCPHLNFDLVLNATQAEIERIFKDDLGPENLTVHSAQRDVHQFYSRASIVVNLSDPRKHVETFGMTLLEGMAYGLPCIAPPVGGVLELVENGINGFLIDSSEIELISESIQKLVSSPALYRKMSNQAFEKSKSFKPAVFSKKVQKVFA